LFSEYHELSISRLDGGILLSFFFLFLLYVYKVSRAKGSAMTQVSSNGTMLRPITLILLGAVGLYFGGQWVVDGAVGLALSWEIDDAVVGLTIVAIGTSAPRIGGFCGCGVP